MLLPSFFREILAGITARPQTIRRSAPFNIPLVPQIQQPDLDKLDWARTCRGASPAK